MSCPPFPPSSGTGPSGKCGIQACPVLMLRAQMTARPGTPNSFSVLIVNWNSRDDLADCLRSLAEQTDRDFETVIVDNGSTDGSQEMVSRDFTWATVIDTGENLGFAEGCNRGIEACSGQWIATLNNDAVADPAWIATLRAAVVSGGPRLGMIQCRILFKQFPDKTNSTGVLIHPNGSAHDRDYHAPARADDVAVEIFCPSAGAALYRREMLDEVKLSTGYFDRSFFMYFEDVDLGWRCRLAQWDAIYLPHAIVHHRFHGSASRRGQYFVKLHCHRNRLQYLLKNASLRFILTTSRQTLWDFTRSLSWGGSAELPAWYAAVRSALARRREMRRLVRVSRRDLEQRWFIQPNSKASS